MQGMMDETKKGPETVSKAHGARLLTASDAWEGWGP